MWSIHSLMVEFIWSKKLFKLKYLFLPAQWLLLYIHMKTTVVRKCRLTTSSVFFRCNKHHFLACQSLLHLSRGYLCLETDWHLKWTYWWFSLSMWVFIPGKHSESCDGLAARKLCTHKWKALLAEVCYSWQLSAGQHAPRVWMYNFSLLTLTDRVRK